MKQIWPAIKLGVHVNGVVKLDTYQDDNLKGKAVFLLDVLDELGSPVRVYISGNCCEMLGGAAIGARLRWEDHQNETRRN